MNKNLLLGSFILLSSIVLARTDEKDDEFVSYSLENNNKEEEDPGKRCVQPYTFEYTNENDEMVELILCSSWAN